MDDVARIEFHAIAIDFVQRNHLALERLVLCKLGGLCSESAEQLFAEILFANFSELRLGLFGREFLEAVAHGKALRQLAEQIHNAHAFLADHYHHGNHREEGVTCREGLECAAIERQICLEQETAIGFVTCNREALVVCIDQAFHAGNHIRATNARTANLFKATGLFKRSVAAHRSCNALDAKRLCGQNAKHVATEPHAHIVCQKRAVRIAVGAEHGIHVILVRKFASEFFVFLADSFGIDRNKHIATAKRLDCRTEAFENLHHDVAAHSGMLVNANRESMQCIATEKVRVTLAIIRFGFRFDRREFRRSLQHALVVKKRFVEIDRLRNNSLFVGLRDFAIRVIELDTVAVSRDVATRHHDGRQMLVNAVHRNSGARDATAVNHLPVCIGASLHERLQNAFRTRTQVARNCNRMFALVRRFAVLDKGTCIHIAHTVSHSAHETAGTARTKRYPGLFHHILHRNGHIKPLKLPIDFTKDKIEKRTPPKVHHFANVNRIAVIIIAAIRVKHEHILRMYILILTLYCQKLKFLYSPLWIEHAVANLDRTFWMLKPPPPSQAICPPKQANSSLRLVLVTAPSRSTCSIAG